ncbi:MAG: Release factor glutamine methyltransferase [Chlamydiae bacterium]|nr:Release factor glutamine methyltransferase [Chlamydiota bacterium]
MKHLKTVLELATAYLEKHKIERARYSSEQLLAHSLEMKPIELYMHHDRPMEEEELVVFRKGLKRKITGEPLEYILGCIEFYHCRIKTGPAALIPRQETEILLDLVNARLDGSERTVLDLCTGSGCLAIGLKKAQPHLQLTAVDLSVEALALAKENAEINQMPIEWLHGDLIEPVRERKFDLVLCNPPYIAEKEYEGLSASVRDFEPKIALVSGESGYEFYERLSRELPQILFPNAKVFFEIGKGQGAGLLKLFSSKNWKDSKVEPDWAGHDRFFSSISLENE